MELANFQKVVEIAERAQRRASLRLVDTKLQSQESQPMNPTCWRCSDRGWITVAEMGARRCLCLRRKIMRTALKIVPKQYGKPKLSRLTPRPDIHPMQRQAIGLAKSNPDDSFLLCGRNASGKTHIGWALYRHAVVSGRKAVGCLLSELIDSYKNFELMPQEEKLRAMRDFTKDRPLILPDDLKSDTRRCTLFLDEFEKARPSEFASECLFRLLNAARDFNHQLIITSNLDWDGMRDRWSRIDEVYGNSIMTRLQGCHLIELF